MSETLLRLKQIVGDKKAGTQPIVPVTAATWWRWVKARKAPQPLKLSPRVTVWRSTDVASFVKHLGIAPKQ